MASLNEGKVEVIVTTVRVGKASRGDVLWLDDNGYLEALVRAGKVEVINPPDWKLSDPNEGFLTKKVEAAPKVVSNDPHRFRLGQPVADEPVAEEPVVPGTVDEAEFDASIDHLEGLVAEEPVVEEPVKRTYGKLGNLPKKAQTESPEGL